jgi:hypothetical protein
MGVDGCVTVCRENTSPREEGMMGWTPSTGGGHTETLTPGGTPPTNATRSTVEPLSHVAVHATEVGRSGVNTNRARAPHRPRGVLAPVLGKSKGPTRWSKVSSNASPSPRPLCGSAYQRGSVRIAAITVTGRSEGDFTRWHHDIEWTHTWPPVLRAATAEIMGGPLTPQEPATSRGIAGATEDRPDLDCRPRNATVTAPMTAAFTST